MTHSICPFTRSTVLTVNLDVVHSLDQRANSLDHRTDKVIIWTLNWRRDPSLHVELNHLTFHSRSPLQWGMISESTFKLSSMTPQVKVQSTPKAPTQTRPRRLLQFPESATPILAQKRALSPTTSTSQDISTTYRLPHLLLHLNKWLSSRTVKYHLE